jgi:hypothetical protein
MKNNALTYLLIGAGIPALVWLLAGVRVNLVEVDTLFAWASVTALLVMALVEYRPLLRRIFGR